MFADEVKRATDKKAAHMREILNSILPPRRWLQDSALVLQQVSQAPATRDDVISLQMTLDERLQQRQAREAGVCPVREELYSQGFDELIRQVRFATIRALVSCARRHLTATADLISP